MRAALRTKPGILFSRLLLVVLIGLLGAAGLYLRAPVSVAHASMAAHAGATTGTLAPVAVVDPLRLAPAKANAPVSSRPKGARSTRGVHRTSQVSRAPVAVAANLVAAHPKAGALRQNFNGVGSLDSANTNFGAEFEPPDQGLCAGNGFVVDAVNSAFTVYRQNGKVVAGPFNVNQLFAEGMTEFTSDPRCQYDEATHTWFAIILFINATNTGARTDVAVNTSGDPTTPWTVYHVDATDDGSNGTPSHPGCPCFGDQPLLGIDQYNLYISTNEFSILGPEFNGAQIYALAKSQLVSRSHAVHVVHLDNLNIGGAVAASVQPAISNGWPEAEFFLNSLDPNGTGDNRVGVWALTDRDAVAKGDVPRLSSLVLTSEAYAIPPGAVQKGATSLLDTGDDRMQQTEYISGDVWGELDTAVSISGDTAQRSGAAWFDVHPVVRDGVLAHAALRNQGYVAVSGSYLLYPALQVNTQGAAAMVVTLSGAGNYPSAAYTVMPGDQRASNDEGGFGAVIIAAPGTGPYDPAATRWGDYSWAILGDDNSVWMATEYIPPVSSQTTDGLRNWGTRVVEVSLH
ncbi:MAG: hypothetical protein ACRDHP_05475 [Ktedonobacterales bacterium]